MSGGDVVWLPWVGLAAALVLLSAWWAVRRADHPAALRRTGYAVGLMGLWALGVPTLVWRLWGALSGWAARLLLSPLSWLGAVVTAVGVLLVLVGVVAGRRRAVRQRPDKAVASPGRAATAAIPARRPGTRAQPDKKNEPGADDEIEAILRKHGIS